MDEIIIREFNQTLLELLNSSGMNDIRNKVVAAIGASYRVIFDHFLIKIYSQNHIVQKLRTKNPEILQPCQNDHPIISALYNHSKILTAEELATVWDYVDHILILGGRYQKKCRAKYDHVVHSV